MQNNPMDRSSTSQPRQLSVPPVAPFNIFSEVRVSYKSFYIQALMELDDREATPEEQKGFKEVIDSYLKNSLDHFEEIQDSAKRLAFRNKFKTDYEDLLKEIATSYSDHDVRPVTINQLRGADKQFVKLCNDHKSRANKVVLGEKAMLKVGNIVSYHNSEGFEESSIRSNDLPLSRPGSTPLPSRRLNFGSSSSTTSGASTSLSSKLPTLSENSVFKSGFGSSSIMSSDSIVAGAPKVRPNRYSDTPVSGASLRSSEQSQDLDEALATCLSTLSLSSSGSSSSDSSSSSSKSSSRSSSQNGSTNSDDESDSSIGSPRPTVSSRNSSGAYVRARSDSDSSSSSSSHSERFKKAQDVNKDKSPRR